MVRIRFVLCWWC